MRLKRLELFGFKSFADRTTMDFGTNSLTGIVGPNGCGKSNVVDAVRWVLGETRPTSMRGAGMVDVIFKGSTSRPPLSIAEVTLVLENVDGRIEERGSEVAVTRRLYKTGEGEYLIDGERVRLKDVRDMLFDTGLGSRGYSVLEQGRIDAVLSANPQQRRVIFEEAAGISRYRQRRHEAELRLKRVEQDGARLEDVMGELRTRVRSLKIQAGKAERWVQARDEWTTLRGRLFRHRLHHLAEALRVLAPEVEGDEAELARLRSARADGEAEMAERERERTSVVSDLDRISTEAGQLEGELRAMDERKSQLGMRIAAWTAASQDEQARAEALRAQGAERADELEGMRADAARLTDAVCTAEAHAAEVSDQAGELRDTYKNVRSEVQAQNEEVLGRLHEKTAAQNRTRHLEESQAPALERSERIARRVREVDASVAGVSAEAGAGEERADALRIDVASGEERAREAKVALDEARAACEALREQRAELEVERAGLEARIGALLDREKEFADLGAGTKQVLEAVESGDGPCSSADLVGLVADNLRVDTRLARALDVVLAERAQALVGRDPETARRVADWLAARESGQVGVCVPSGLGRRELAPLPECMHVVEGRLYDFVRCAAGAEALGRELCGDVVVVDTLERALELVQCHPGWRFVTPRGELVDAAGLVGGHRELWQGAVGRRSSAAEMEARVLEIDGELEGLSVLAERSAEHRARAAERGARLAQELDELRAELGEAEAALSTARARLDDLLGSREALEREHAEARAEVESLARETAAADAARVRAEESFEAQNARLEEMEVGRRRIEERRERIAREEAAARVEVTRLRGERNTLERRIEDQIRRVGETESGASEADRRAELNAQHARDGEVESEQLGEESSLVVEKRGAVDGRLDELRALERSGRERVEEVRRAVEAVQAELDAVGERLSERRLLVQRRELEHEEVLRRSAEELSLSRSDLEFGFEPDPELAQDDALAQLEARTTELKAALDKLGPVNMDAVEELEEVGGRLEFLETQSGDLAQSRKLLDETIKKIDEESRRLFLETFEEVRGHFQVIFRQLFGGGRAEIALEEGLDVLEAGIEITARPPGREMLSIALLSGGQRTMTALALLFAVFQARPSPFCVLDEVDAALDDANIDRFLAMLDGFRETTQFIVVTHNKGSMAACEALYGVTMEVKGVSRYVSVELDDVDEFAPEATGGGARPSESGEPREAAPVAAEGVDAESGEPVVEIVPARADAKTAPTPDTLQSRP